MASRDGKADVVDQIDGIGRMDEVDRAGPDLRSGDGEASEPTLAEPTLAGGPSGLPELGAGHIDPLPSDDTAPREGITEEPEDVTFVPRPTLVLPGTEDELTADDVRAATEALLDDLERRGAVQPRTPPEPFPGKPGESAERAPPGFVIGPDDSDAKGGDDDDSKDDPDDKESPISGGDDDDPEYGNPPFEHGDHAQTDPADLDGCDEDDPAELDDGTGGAEPDAAPVVPRTGGHPGRSRRWRCRSGSRPPR